jgi:4,5-DOPA dioxygenase extradiol
MSREMAKLVIRFGRMNSKLLGGFDLKRELDHSRGFDLGIFIPLMIMYPEAAIPVDEWILFMGLGYSFHNMQSFFNPSQMTMQTSVTFNQWLKDTILRDNSDHLE